MNNFIWKKKKIIQNAVEIQLRHNSYVIKYYNNNRAYTII